jgi:hypothetical protein
MTRQPRKWKNGVGIPLEQKSGTEKTNALKGIIVTLEVLKLLGMQVDNVRNEVVEEVTVMRNNKQSLFPTSQVSLKPNSSVQIQVVGRFIQNQQVGTHK